MMRHGERERTGHYEEARQRRLLYARHVDRAYFKSIAIVAAPILIKPVKKRPPKHLGKPLYPLIVPTLAAVSKATGFSYDQLIGYRRGRLVARARQMMVGLFQRQYPDLKTKAMARMFERDRTTIFSSLRQFERYHQVEPMRTWLEHVAIRSLK